MTERELLERAVVLLDGAGLAYFDASRCGTLEPANRVRMRRNRLAVQAASKVLEAKLKRMERKPDGHSLRKPE